MAQATWWKTIKNLRVHLNITKVKVVHHVSHQNFFKKSNIGIVLPLKERMAPSLFSWNRVENINFEEKGHLSVRPISFSIWVFLSRNPENLQKKWQIWIWMGWLTINILQPRKTVHFLLYSLVLLLLTHTLPLQLHPKVFVHPCSSVRLSHLGCSAWLVTVHLY